MISVCFTEPQLRDHLAVNAVVWGMDEMSIVTAVQERMSYVALPERRGGYIIARDREGRAIGNGTFRLSSDGRAMYLIGSTMLPGYQNRGVCHALLQSRFHRGKEAGCKLLTVQARVGTSKPILVCVRRSG